MQISLPIHTVNRYWIVYVNKIVCHKNLDKANSIININFFLNDWDLDTNKIM